METFDWHYIGRFGQLGPLSTEQMQELVKDEVIQADTYVWRTGMAEWVRAGQTAEFGTSLVRAPIPTAPPSSPAPQIPIHTPPNLVHPSPYATQTPMTMVPFSTRSRVASGILNIFFPGIGRLYLGYVGTGLLQLFGTLCFGLGALWSFVDGILMLTGSVKTDGLGKPLRD